MEYSFQTYVDVGLTFYGIYLIKLFIEGSVDFWRWRNSTYQDPDLEFIFASPKIHALLQNVFYDVYPGYLLSDEEKKESFWKGTRWPMCLPVSLFSIALAMGHYELCCLIVATLYMKITMFWQAIHCITEETLDRVILILDS